MKNLLKLQALDLKIEECRRREDEIPKQKSKFDIHRSRLDAELKESEDRVKRLQLEQRECEGEIDQKQQQIRKYDTQLLSVKKNEEYQALLHEIDALKRQIGQKEERIITIMVELDEARVHLEEDKKRITAERSAIESQCKEIDQELAAAVKSREALQAERKPLLTQVDPAMLNRYLRIRKSKGGGAAIVPLREESCSGCHMRVTPQIINEVMAGHKVHTCAHCGRLLYFGANFEGEPAEIAQTQG